VKSIFFFLALTALSAHAGNRACMIESTYFTQDLAIQMRDCMQAPLSITEEALRTQCTKLAAIAPSMGGKARSLEYMESCPAPAQAACMNYMHSGNDAYYYERQPNDLMLLPKACASRGGTWVPGG
jgi:hypothetical protein